MPAPQALLSFECNPGLNHAATFNEWLSLQAGSYYLDYLLVLIKELAAFIASIRYLQDIKNV
jgi:hypothetical protein